MPGPSEKPPIPQETDPIGKFLEPYVPALEDRLARSIAAINRSDRSARRDVKDAPPEDRKGEPKPGGSRRRKAAEQEDAATADSVPDPLRMDVKTQTALQDRWVEQLIAQCNGDPKLAAVAGELQALVGKNPEDSVLRALEEKLKTLTTSTSPDPMPAPVSPIKRKVESAPIPEEKKKSVWNKERLFGEIKDGTRFIVSDKDGKVTGYRREGDKLLKGKNTKKDDTEEVLESLSFGGTWGSKDVLPLSPDAVSSQPPKADDVIDNVIGAPVPPAMPAAPTIDTALDAGIDKSKEKIRLPKDGEELYYTTTSGRVMVGYSLGDNRYSITNIDVPGFDEDDLMSVANATSYNYTADKILLIAKEQGWKLSDAPVTAPKAPADVPAPPAMSPASPDATFNASKDKIKLPKSRERLYYTNADGCVAVETVILDSGKRNYLVVNIDAPDFDPDRPLWYTGVDDLTEDQVLLMAKEQGWKPSDPIRPRSGKKELPVLNDALESKFIPLAAGKKEAYVGKEGRIIVEGLGGGRYKLTDASGEVIDVDCDVDRVHNLAKTEKWVRAEDLPVLNQEAQEVKMGIKLAEGEKARYISVGGILYNIEKQKDGYYIQSAVDREGPVNEETLNQRAVAEKWVPVLETKKGIESPIPTPDPAPASPEAPKPIEQDMTEIEKLRILLDEARLEYVRTDYNQGKLWAKITGIISKLRKKERGDTDTQSAFERYRKALTSLMEAELAQLKSSGITGEELKVEMVRILNFYTAGEHMNGEKLNLKLVRQQMEAEDKDKWTGTMVLEQFESLGKWYQKRSAKEKILLGGAGLLMGSTAIATAGTVTGLVAGGAFLTTKLLTSAAAGVTADGLMEACEARLEKWLEERKREKSMEELERANTPLTKFDAESVSPEVLEILSKRAQEQIDALDDRARRKKLTKVVRKTLAVGIGVGLASYFTYKTFFSDAAEAAAAAAHARDAAEVARALGVEVPADVPAVTTEGGVKLDNAEATVKQYLASHPSGGASAELLPGAASAAVSEGASGAVSPPLGAGVSMQGIDPFFNPDHVAESALSEQVSAQTALLREAYPVTDMDGKRGLWGVIDERLKHVSGDMKLEERNRVIASIQNLMRQDLEAMSPTERASAGFAKGELNLIHKGTVIHFDEFKSLTSGRLQAIIDGQSVGAPSGADVIDRPTGVPGSPSLIDQNAIDEGGTTAAQAVAENVRESAYGIPVSPMDHALNQETITRLADQPMTPQNPTAAVQEVIRGERPAVAPSEGVAPRGVPVADHVVVRPESVVAANETETPLANAHEAALFREACTQNVGALRHDILLTPPAGMTSMGENFHLAKYDYAMNPSLGLINVEQVLEASWELHNGTGARSPMNWAKYPLHPTQIDSVARAVAVAQDPRILGRWGAPLSGETIDKYTARIGVALTKANKAQMFSMLLNGRGLRLAA